MRPREYFAKFLATAEDEIDYSEIPPTTAADWEDAEVLLPMTSGQFDRRRCRMIGIKYGQRAQPRRRHLLGSHRPHPRRSRPPPRHDG